MVRERRSKQQLAEHGLSTLRQLRVGQTARVPVSCLTPTQPDDGKPPQVGFSAPVEVVLSPDGKALVRNGNHRYYRRKDLEQPTSVPHILARKVGDLGY